LLGDEPVLDAEITYYQRLLAHDEDEATELIESAVQEGKVDCLYDGVLLPTLVLAKRDRENGELAPEDEEFVLQATRNVLNDQLAPQQQIKVIATQEPDHELEAPKILLLGCPARD